MPLLSFLPPPPSPAPRFFFFLHSQTPRPNVNVESRDEYRAVSGDLPLILCFPRWGERSLEFSSLHIIVVTTRRQREVLILLKINPQAEKLVLL